MKKLLERIASVAVAVIGTLLIALLLAVMFQAIDVAELDNRVVKILIGTLSVSFAILAILGAISAFSEDDRLHDVLIFKDRGSATKATVGVVKNLAKKAVKDREDARIKKVILFVDDNGNVKLRIHLKTKGDATEAIVDRVRAEISSTISAVLGVEFSSIDFKVVGIRSQYRPNDQEIDAKIEAYQRAKEEAENKQLQAESAQEEVTAASDLTDETAPGSSDETQSLGITSEPQSAISPEEVVEHLTRPLEGPEKENLGTKEFNTDTQTESIPQED